MKMNLAIAEFAKTLAGVYDNIEQSQHQCGDRDELTPQPFDSHVIIPPLLTNP